ncbi:MAG: hypothetical protein H0W89_02190 [Candidatus Levybacteria bacterium]|nr:hypothetical protein [Candidatus Levybacteria bacterium]
MSSIIKKYLLDIFLVAVLIIISFSISAFLLQGEILSPGYEDWMAHAFRIQILDQYGYTSWIHNWSNGISIWNSYQFVPHIITLFVVKAFGLSITTAMIYLTVAQFVLLRVFIYIIMRLLNFGTFTAFVISLLSLSIAQFWQGVNEYSLMFAFTFSPLFIYLWILYYNNKISLFFVYSIGLSFYIHPILGLSLIALWLLGNILSNKTVLSKSILIEFLIILATSSLFWLPLLQVSNYTFPHSYYSTREFLALALQTYEFYGLNLTILLLFATTILVLFKNTANLSWGKVLYIFASLYLLLVIVGVQFELPHFISQTQFPRGVFFIGISMLFVIASLIEYIVKSKILIVKLVLILFLTIAFVDNLWYATIYSPTPQYQVNDPIKSVYEHNIPEPFTEGKVWSPYIGSSSYYADSDVSSPYSYMAHLEPNSVAQRLTQHLLYTNQEQNLTLSSTETINNYLKLTGTKYILLNNDNLLGKSFIENNKENIKQVKLIEGKYEDFNYIKMNWEITNAFLVNENSLKLPHFPKEVDILSNKDQKQLDELVNTYMSEFKQSGKPVNVIYPSNDQVNVAIPSGNTLPYLFVNESYDPQWRAYINDKEVSVSSFGPNFMLVDVRDTNGGTLVLKHTWPISHYVSLFLIFFTGASLLIYRLVEKVGRKEKHEVN